MHFEAHSGRSIHGQSSCEHVPPWKRNQNVKASYRYTFSFRKKETLTTTTIIKPTDEPTWIPVSIWLYILYIYYMYLNKRHWNSIWKFLWQHWCHFSPILSFNNHKSRRRNHCHWFSDPLMSLIGNHFVSFNKIQVHFEYDDCIKIVPSGVTCTNTFTLLEHWGKCPHCNSNWCRKWSHRV